MNNPTETQGFSQASTPAEAEGDLSGHTMDKSSEGHDHGRLHDVTIAADYPKDAETSNSEEPSTSTLLENDNLDSAKTLGTLQASGEEANETPELESIYKSIETYDWENDKVYQRGLQNMSRSTDVSPYELELRARCFYWSRKTKSKVDFSGYRNWKMAQHQASQTTFAPQGSKDYSALPIDSLTASLNQPIFTKPATSPASSKHVEEPSNQTSLDEPPAPYPQNFQEVAEMITSGRGHLLPGIREIPPVVLTEKITAPTKELRKKPWEKDDALSPEAKGGMFGDRRDIFIRQEMIGDDD